MRVRPSFIPFGRVKDNFSFPGCPASILCYFFMVMKLIYLNKFETTGNLPSRLASSFCCVLFFLLFMGNRAFAAYQPDLMVRLASEPDASYLGRGVYEGSASVQSRSQAAYSGIPARFSVLLVNAGDRPDRFLVTAPGSGSAFTVSYTDAGGVDRVASFSGAGYLTPEIPPGASTLFLVQVNPVFFSLGASYRVTLTAVSAGDPLAADQVKTETVACGQTAAVTLSAPPDGLGAPGTVVNYPYTVTNVGNTVDSFNLTVSGGAGWQGGLFLDDGAGGGVAGDGVRQPGENHGCVSTGTLAPGASFRFLLAVTVPESGNDGARSDHLVAATGSGASGADQVGTRAVAPVLGLAEAVRNLTRGGAFQGSAEAVPGDEIQYRMGITNSGSAPATLVSLDSPIPTGLTVAVDTLFVSLSPTGEGTPCAAVECGVARISAGGIVATLGQGARDAAGGSIAPGRTVYVFFKAKVQ